MGVQLPQRAGAPGRRLLLGSALASGLLLLSGCSAEAKHQWENFAMPDPATKEAWVILDFWRWSWVALMVTGVVVWGLIFYAVWRYRRRSDDEIPVQTRYNLPLEVFYTIFPIVMIVVFFAKTVGIQSDLVAVDPNPDHTVIVVGQQWSWTFNYIDEPVADGKNVYEFGTTSYVPTLVLPVDESVRFELRSADVIHSFWVTGFLYKEDVIPGRDNEFEVTPNKIGSFHGKCAELCGTSHSRMLFNVEVVSREDYDAYLQKQMAAGFVSDAPLVGPDYITKEAGLDSTSQEGGSE